MRNTVKMFSLAIAVFIGLCFTAKAQTTDPACDSVSQIHGVFNMSCFLRQSGESDDTARIQRAVNTAANNYGGTLVFGPNIYNAQTYDGSYVVSGNGVSLPGGIIIQGVNNTDYAVPTRLKRSGSGAIFTIGVTVKDITIRDIALFASSLSTGTIGIKASGATSTTAASFNIRFDNLTFTNLDKGIQVVATDGSSEWQFDNVRLEHSIFANCNTGVELDSYNTGWNMTSCSFFAPANGIGVNIIKGGYISMTLMIGNGPLTGTKADVLFKIGGHGNVTIQNSISEGFTRSLKVVAADRNYPITLVNNTFGDGVLLDQTCTVISTGNFYGPDTVDVKGATQIFSFGDKFCYEGQSPCTPGDFKLYDTAAIMFRAGLLKNTTTVPTKIYNYVRIENDAGVNYPDGDPEGSGAIPLMSVISPTNAEKVLIRLGQTSTYTYDISRDSTNGALNFKGNQAGYAGYKFTMNGGTFKLDAGDVNVNNGNLNFSGSGTVTVGSKTYSNLGSPANGTMYYCSDCKRNTSTGVCNSGGGGAMAKRIANAWKCEE